MGEEQGMRPDWREILTVGLVVWISRLALVGAFYALTGGREFSDDGAMFNYLIDHPLDLITGETRKVAQHPPLLPVVMATFAAPLKALLPDFLALRGLFVLFEGLAAALVMALLQGLGLPPSRRRLAAALLVLSPLGWMASCVMSQDEVIAAAMLAGSLALLSWGRTAPALLLAGLGVVAGKIFLAAPLLAMIALAGRGGWLTRGVIGGAPVALAYAAVVIGSQLRGLPPPLASFAPPAEFGVSLWVWLSASLSLDGEAARRLSSPLALVGGLLPVGLALWRGRAGVATVVVAGTAMLAWIWALFYHVNPEYYLLLLPGLALLCDTWRKVAAALVFSCLPWAVNFFFGVKNAVAAGGGGGKGIFVKIYQVLFPVPPEVMFHLALGACILGTWLFAAWATRLVVSLGAPRDVSAR